MRTYLRVRNDMMLTRRCIYSECGKYRYTLHRQWSGINNRAVLFLLLNPSTATDEQDDPTIRRCTGYAKSWGFGRMMIGNICAYRSTCPLSMKLAEDPVGVCNDQYLESMASEASLIVAGWGNHGTHLGRAASVRKMFRGRLHYLRLTKIGEPSHPLYLPGSLTPKKL